LEQTPPFKSTKLLFIDIMNFADKFELFTGGRTPWSIKDFEASVRSFVELARNSGFEIAVFFDGEFYRTQASRNNWIKKRELEFERERKWSPHRTNILLGNAFRKAGADVHYSYEADLMDTLASHAFAAGASILTCARDIFKYLYLNSDGPLIYRKFDYSPDGKTLEVSPLGGARVGDMKKDTPVVTPRPQTRSYLNLSVVKETLSYRQGCSSPLPRLENLLLTVRPLRQAAYQRLGIKGPVTENLAAWRNRKVEWEVEDVHPDLKFDALLDPQKAFEKFFLETETSEHNGILWSNHVFSMWIVILEIVASVKDEVSLLELMQQYCLGGSDQNGQNEWRTVNRAPWKSTDEGSGRSGQEAWDSTGRGRGRGSELRSNGIRTQSKADVAGSWES